MEKGLRRRLRVTKNILLPAGSILQSSVAWTPALTYAAPCTEGPSKPRTIFRPNPKPKPRAKSPRRAAQRYGTALPASCCPLPTAGCGASCCADCGSGRGSAVRRSSSGDCIKTGRAAASHSKCFLKLTGPVRTQRTAAD